MILGSVSHPLLNVLTALTTASMTLIMKPPGPNAPVIKKNRTGLKRLYLTIIQKTSRYKPGDKMPGLESTFT